MEVELEEIKARLESQFTGTRRIVFWEDPSGTYEEAIGYLQLDNARLINVEGSELSAKREVLRTNKEEKYVLYRAGETPAPTDDFLYDIKLAALPFSCSMEGIWADECKVDPRLAPVLADHSKFFNSKDRKSRLADTSLSKDTAEDIEFAMLAACAKTDSDNMRDATRSILARLLVEAQADKQPTMQLIMESGLTGALWTAAYQILGYQVPEGAMPSLDDLAYQMFATACASVLAGSPQTLSADADRILDGLARNPKTRDAFERMEARVSDTIRTQIDPECKSPEALKDADALRCFDEIILLALVDRLDIGSLTSNQAEEVFQSRQFTLWADRYALYYACILAAAHFFEAKEAYDNTIAACTTAKDVFDAYCERFYEVDTFYRQFLDSYGQLGNGQFKQRLGQTKQRICAAYDNFLITLTDKWQLYLCEEDGVYPPKSIYSQKDFFRKEVEEIFPRAEKGKRVGVIVSDALRYEVGVELATYIAQSKKTALRGKAKTSVAGALSMLPSYTQLGMAALLPSGSMEINPNTEVVLKDGESTQGKANREKILNARIAGSVALSARDVLDAGIGDVSSAPLVYVYHNVIDKRGDSRETEEQVFSACDDALREIETIVAELVKAGCGKVIVTADHGFLYQDQSIENHQFVDVPNLSVLANVEGADTSYSRRYIVSKTPVNDEMLIDYAAIDLSLEGDYRILLPKGICRLRLRGSGARYVHGGASLQENAIPIVAIDVLKSGEATHQTGVQGFPTGRCAITGSSVTLTVYQTEECSDTVTPTKIKVGVYAPNDSSKLLSTAEKSLELSSTSKSSEDRKTQVTLDVTNDIDNYQSAVIRISTQVNNTNQFVSAWEEVYIVSRAFGNDFDF